MRKSRFHDEKGNRVDVGGLIYAPAAFVTAAVKRLFGRRARRPMISYRFTALLDARMRRDWVVVEFGSGMSTPWLAARCARLISFEDDEAWAARVRSMLDGDGITNVEVRFRPRDAYPELSGLADRSVDFALVDGTDREGCVRAVLPKMKAGSWIYLDNSDKDMTRPKGDLRRAEAALRQAAEAMGWPTRTFTDFAPGNFFAEQGLLVEVTAPWEGG